MLLEVLMQATKFYLIIVSLYLYYENAYEG